MQEGRWTWLKGTRHGERREGREGGKVRISRIRKEGNRGNLVKENN